MKRKHQTNTKHHSKKHSTNRSTKKVSKATSHKNKSFLNQKTIPVFLLLLLVAIIGIIVYILATNTSTGNLFGKAVTTSTVEVTSCPGSGAPLITSGVRYVLLNDLTSTDLCFYVVASDIIIDGDGHTINSGSASAIAFAGTKSDITIEDMTITSTGTNPSIWISGAITRAIVQNVAITSTGVGAKGIFIDGSSTSPSPVDTTIRDSTITMQGDNSVGIYSKFTKGTRIINTNIISNSQSSGDTRSSRKGVLLHDDSGTIIEGGTFEITKGASAIDFYEPTEHFTPVTNPDVSITRVPISTIINGTTIRASRMNFPPILIGYSQSSPIISSNSITVYDSSEGNAAILVADVGTRNPFIHNNTITIGDNSLLHTTTGSGIISNAMGNNGEGNHIVGNTIRMNDAGQTGYSSASAIKLSGGNSFVSSNDIIINNPRTYGIVFSGLSSILRNITIQNNSVLGGAIPIFVVKVHDVNILNNTISGNDYPTTSQMDSPSLLLEKASGTNVIRGNTGAKIRVTRSENVTVSDHNAITIQVSDSNNTHITNNIVTAQAFYQESLGGSSVQISFSRNITIKNNTITLTSTAPETVSGLAGAVGITEGRDIIFASNTITTTGYGAQALLVQASTNLTLLNSTISTTGNNATGIDVGMPSFIPPANMRFKNVNVTTQGINVFGLKSISAGFNTGSGFDARIAQNLTFENLRINAKNSFDVYDVVSNSGTENEIVRFSEFITFKPVLPDGTPLPNGSSVRSSGLSNPSVHPQELFLLYNGSSSILNRETTLLFPKSDRTVMYDGGAQNYTLYNITISTPDRVYNSSFIINLSNLTSSTITSTVTNPAPVISILQPVDGLSVSITNPIFSVYFADADLKSIAIVIDGVSQNVDTTPNDPPLNGEVGHVRTLSNGVHTWYARAEDNGGSVTTSPVRTLIVDTEAPAITILEPQPFSRHNTYIVARANITDPQGVAPSSVLIHVGGTNSAVTRNGTIYTATIPNFVQLTNNNYTLSVVAQDTLGNERTQKVNFAIDIAPPTQPNQSVLRPTTGNTTGANPHFIIPFNDTDIQSCTITINGTSHSLTVSSDKCVGPEDLNLTDGVYNYTINVSDLAGNSYQTAMQNFTVDATPPTITPYAPIDGEVYSSSVPIQYTVTDSTSPIVNSSVLLTGSVGNQRSAGLSTNGSAWNGTFATTGLSDGAYTFTVDARDGAGNTRTVTRSITVDLTPPLINNVSQTPNSTSSNGSQAPPSGGLINTSTPEFNFTIGDTTNVTCKLTIDNVVYNLTRNGTSCALIPPVNLSEGLHNYTLNVTDGANNSVISGAHNFTIDTKPPIINVKTPATNPVYPSLSDTILYLNFTTNDTNLSGVTATLKNTTGSNTTINLTQALPITWTGNISLVNLTDGNYTITYTANDTVGHETITTTTIIIDRTPPTITLITPAHTGTVTAGMNTFRANVTDKTFNNATLIIDNNQSMTITTTTSEGIQTYSYNLSAGTHYWNVTATDKSGNKNTSEMRTVVATIAEITPNVTQQQPAPEPEPQPKPPVKEAPKIVTATLSLLTPSEDIYKRPVTGITYTVPTLASPQTKVSVTASSALSLACAAVTQSTAQETISITPATIDKKLFPKGTEAVTQPFGTNCNGESLQLTFSLPEAYKDIKLVTCTGGTCTKGEALQPTGNLTCGGATLKELATTLTIEKTPEQKATDIITGNSFSSGSFTLTKAYTHAQAQNTLILVHGIFGNKNTFKGLVTEFAFLQQPWDIWVAEYDYNQPLDTLGKEFSTILEKFPSKNIYIAGHSLGGLVTQQAIYQIILDKSSDTNRHPELSNIKKVILLGTPNQGSPATAIYDTLKIESLRPELSNGKFLATPETIQQLVTGKNIPRAKGITYEVIAGTQPYTFTQSFFSNEKKNDGIVGVTSARTVGGAQINNSCSNYYEAPVSHTDMNDNELIARLISRSVNSELSKTTKTAIAGYSQYQTITIPSCSATTTYALVGTPVRTEEAFDATGCSCGNNYCGAGETDASCPSDCATFFGKNNLTTRILPFLAYALVTVLAVLSLYSIDRTFRKKIAPDQSIIIGGLATEAVIVVFAAIQYFTTGTLSYWAYIASFLLTGLLLITLAVGGPTGTRTSNSETEKREAESDEKKEDMKQTMAATKKALTEEEQPKEKTPKIELWK